MIRTIQVTVLIAITALLLSGCASSGVFSSSHLTNVELSKGNFKIVAKDAAGEATAGYIFGTSYSMGLGTMTFAVARVSGSGALYKEALDNLWKNVEQKTGTVEGKKLALTNVRYDSDIVNLFFYTEVKVTVRADVVEFTE